MNNNFVLDKVYTEIAATNHKLLEIWLNTIVFSWRWWIGFALTVVPWTLWILYHDKRKTGRYLLIGLLSACTTNFLDMVGLSFGLWHYDWKMIPLVASYIPWDFSLFPVSVMFLMQLKPSANPWIKAVVFSFACAFIFEPAFLWLKMYHIIHWSYLYSFFIYIFFYYLLNMIFKSKILSDLP